MAQASAAKPIDRPLNEIVVFGRSVGSIYAIDAVSRFPALGGLILESGIHSVKERLLARVTPAELGASDAELDAALAPVDAGEKLKRYQNPALILHAEHDHLVGVHHAHDNLAALSQSQDAQLRILPRGDHNSIFAENRIDYETHLRGFLAKG